MVHKNKTPFRPSLGLDGTLSSIITVKLGIEDPCEKFEPTSSLLDTAKKATWEYNKGGTVFDIFHNYIIYFIVFDFSYFFIINFSA